MKIADYSLALTIVLLTAIVHLLAKYEINNIVFEVINDESLKRTISYIDALFAFLFPLLIFGFIVITSKLTSILVDTTLTIKELMTAVGIAFIWICINATIAYLVLGEMTHENFILLNKNIELSDKFILPFGYSLRILKIQMNISYMLMAASTIAYLIRIYKVNFYKTLIIVLLPYTIVIFLKLIIE